MNPLLSIIIPFFGNANKKLLERCIASIRQQDIDSSQYEIIITNDGGNGVYAARNNGIKQAKGKYIFFVDADDYIFPDTLKKCLSLLKSEKPDMLTFRFQHVDNSKPDIDNTVYQKRSYASGADYMLHHNYFGTVWRFFIRRNLILEKELMFCLKSHHQDETFCAEAYFMAESVVDITLIVYAYCKQRNSLVHHRGILQRQERITDFHNVLTMLLLFSENHPQASEIQKNALKRRISFLTIDFLWQLIRNRCTFSQFKQQIRLLREEKLLPLPARKYNTKYILIRPFINLLTFPLYI